MLNLLCWYFVDKFVEIKNFPLKTPNDANFSSEAWQFVVSLTFVKVKIISCQCLHSLFEIQTMLFLIFRNTWRTRTRTSEHWSKENRIEVTALRASSNIIQALIGKFSIHLLSKVALRCHLLFPFFSLIGNSKWNVKKLLSAEAKYFRMWAN